MVLDLDRKQYPLEILYLHDHYPLKKLRAPQSRNHDGLGAAKKIQRLTSLLITMMRMTKKAKRR